jgi:hypothetical protein
MKRQRREKGTEAESLLRRPCVTQPVKKFSGFYSIRSFTTVFTRDNYSSSSVK